MTYDHLGNKYTNVAEMCQTYGVNKKTYENRRAKGWTKEKALSPVIKPEKKQKTKREIITKFGTFKSYTEISKKFDISKDIIYRYLKSGKSIDDIIASPTIRECSDHLGNTFVTKSEMCKVYNISLELFNRRIKNNWPLKDALTIPPMESQDIPIVDCTGRYFAKKSDMFKAYNIDNKRYKIRLKNGWSQFEALNIIPRVNKTIKYEHILDGLIVCEYLHSNFYLCVYNNHDIILSYDEIINIVKNHYCEERT